MKIAVVCPYNLEIPGGVQEHVLAEAQELRRRKHKVVIVTPKPRRRKKPADKGIYYIGQMARIPMVNNTQTDFSATADYKAIEDFFEYENPDLMHMHEPVVPIVSRQLLSQATCPVVGTYHAAQPENIMGRGLVSSFMPYVRAVTKQLTRITIVSEAAKMLLEDEDIEPIIIPNGVDLRKYKSLSTKRDPNQVLFVGRLEKRKGVYELLDAFKLLKEINPKARLDIVGGGPLWSRLHRRADELDLDDVTFHGFVSDMDKRRMMSSCGVFTSPATHGESFGIVLVEAMAMGCGVVAGNNPGYRTVMKDRGSISLVDSTDSEAFAARLHLFMSDSKLVNIWKQWARQTIKQYDWPIVVDKYEELFKKLV
ncbi:MAG: glycosyltransferase family 4 protein [bacterium]|nr:glycosyltransferase family 4 protein [bacterium]